MCMFVNVLQWFILNINILLCCPGNVNALFVKVVVSTPQIIDVHNMCYSFDCPSFDTNWYVSIDWHGSIPLVMFSICMRATCKAGTTCTYWYQIMIFVCILSSSEVFIFPFLLRVCVYLLWWNDISFMKWSSIDYTCLCMDTCFSVKYWILIIITVGVSTYRY